MIKTYHKGVLSLIVAGMVIANLVFWGGRLLKKNSTGSNFVKTIRLPHFHMENDKGDVIDSDGLNAGLNVLIFFTLEDCPACLYEAVFWEEAAEVFKTSDVSFWGITTEKERSRIQEFVSEYQISFPIFFDNNGKLREKILSTNDALKRSITTPFKVFVKRNRGIIRIEGPKKDVEEQKLFLGIISEILSGKDNNGVIYLPLPNAH